MAKSPLALSIRRAHVEVLARACEIMAHGRAPGSTPAQPPQMLRYLIDQLARRGLQYVLTDGAWKEVNSAQPRVPRKVGAAGTLAYLNHPASKRPHHRPIVVNLEPDQLKALSDLALITKSRSKAAQLLIHSFYMKSPAIQREMTEWDPTLTYRVK
jgi:hypothetical protein